MRGMLTSEGACVVKFGDALLLDPRAITRFLTYNHQVHSIYASDWITSNCLKLTYDVPLEAP